MFSCRNNKNIHSFWLKKVSYLKLCYTKYLDSQVQANSVNPEQNVSDQGATPFVPLIQQFQDIPIHHDLVKKIRAMMLRLKCYGNKGSKIFNPFMPSIPLKGHWQTV